MGTPARLFNKTEESCQTGNSHLSSPSKSQFNLLLAVFAITTPGDAPVGRLPCAVISLPRWGKNPERRNFKIGFSAIHVENGRGDLRSALSAGSGDPRRTPVCPIDPEIQISHHQKFKLRSIHVCCSQKDSRLRFSTLPEPFSTPRRYRRLTTFQPQSQRVSRWRLESPLLPWGLLRPIRICHPFPSQ